MNDLSRENFIKLIQLIVLLTPTAFLFHYIETSLFENGFTFAFLGTILFVLFAGVISVKIKWNYIFLISILSILLSILLGGMFITAPNESWFNPFGMHVVIGLTGLLILSGILIIRFIASRIFNLKL